jgi:hypothetical protein
MTYYAIKAPMGLACHFSMEDSLAASPDAAWSRFCHPSLRREGYEADGFKAVPVTITVLESTDE